MQKTTIYLPEALKAAVERAASEERRSEAELIREAIAEKLAQRNRTPPRVPLRAEGLGDPLAAERVDDLLDGFGQR
jgi:Arc/MetJ-type ribon-helix-helix transcriptional regulator